MTLTRFCILLLFFCSLVGLVVFYAYGQPLTARWFLVGLAAAWVLRSKFSPDDTSEKP